MTDKNSKPSKTFVTPVMPEQILSIAEINEFFNSSSPKLNPLPVMPSPLPPIESSGNQVVDAFITECLNTFHTKGYDYQRGNDDILHSFKTISQEVDIDKMKAWYVLFYKQYAAMVTYIKNGKSESEPIGNRIMDMVVYLILLDYMIKQNNK